MCCSLRAEETRNSVFFQEARTRYASLNFCYSSHFSFTFFTISQVDVGLTINGPSLGTRQVFINDKLVIYRLRKLYSGDGECMHQLSDNSRCYSRAASGPCVFNQGT